MKKLMILTMLLFTTITMADTSVGFGENSRCKSGYEVYFDKTVIDYSRGEVLNIDLCIEAPASFDYRFSREGNRVFVDVSYRGIGYSPFPYVTFPIPVMLLGFFEEDKNDIAINVRLYYPTESDNFAAPPYQIYTQKVTINDDNYYKSVTDPTGSWYDRTLDGTGFTVMQFDNGSVVQYYGYDSEGKRLWLLSNVIDETWIKGKAKTLIMYEGKADNATNFTTPPANAPGVLEWGNVEIRFDSCNVGYAKLSGTDGEQTFNLTKLAAPSGVHCMAQ